MSTSQKHPSHGVVSINRSVGGSRRFFGSEVKHGTSVTLTISPCERQVDNFGTHYYPRNPPYVQIEMSSEQWANLITSINVGCGVPCTISRLNGEHVEPEQITETFTEKSTRKFRERVSNKISEARSIAAGVRTFLETTNLSKKAKDEINSSLDRIVKNFAANEEYFLTEFTAEADKVLTSAKAELDSFIGQVMMQVGNNVLTQSDKCGNTKFELPNTIDL